MLFHFFLQQHGPRKEADESAFRNGLVGVELPLFSLIVELDEDVEALEIMGNHVAAHATSLRVAAPLARILAALPDDVWEALRVITHIEAN